VGKVPGGFSGGLRVLLGVVMLQAVTGLIVYTAFETELAQTWPLFAALAFAVGLFATLWFGALVSAERGRTAVHLGERFSKEREEIRTKAEALRVKAIREAERAAAKARGGPGSNRLMLKTGVILGGVVIGGGVLVLSQFVTAGLLAVVGGGGAALGYWGRVRQERALARRVETVEVIEPPVPPKRRIGGAKAAQDA
jgi:hypothetical protein